MLQINTVYINFQCIDYCIKVKAGDNLFYLLCQSLFFSRHIAAPAVVMLIR